MTCTKDVNCKEEISQNALEYDACVVRNFALDFNKNKYV